mgnify:CR=1 FL=1
MGVGVYSVALILCFFFFQAEDGIRDLVRSRGLGDVYKRQAAMRADGDAPGERVQVNLIDRDDRHTRAQRRPSPVSYTHLTLPTIYSV